LLSTSTSWHRFSHTRTGRAGPWSPLGLCSS